MQNVHTYNNNNNYTNKFRARNQTQQYQNSNYQRSFRRNWNEDRRQKHVHERYPAHSNSNSNYWTRYVNTKNCDERKNMNMNINMNRKENQEEEEQIENEEIQVLQYQGRREELNRTGDVEYVLSILGIDRVMQCFDPIPISN